MNIALVLSGGAGSRMGIGVPKQYLEVKGRKIITYALDVLMRHKDIDAVQIVAANEYREEISDQIDIYIPEFKDKFAGFSEPGETRQLSIVTALVDISGYAPEEAHVLIHDAARPCITADIIDRCIEALKDHEGVMPVLPVKDAVYKSKDGSTVYDLLNKAEVYTGQAPEGFALGKYLKANWKLLPTDIYKVNGSTDPAVLAGMDVVMIPGDEKNFSIITKEDLDRFRELVRKG